MEFIVNKERNIRMSTSSNSKQRIPRITAFVAAITLGTAAWAQQGGQHSAGQHSPSGSTPSSEMHQSMQPGMQKMMEMKSTGDVDRDFASMMKIHHQMAIDMAQAQIKNGKSPELKAMARKITEDSKKDIGELDKWLAAKK